MKTKIATLMLLIATSFTATADSGVETHPYEDDVAKVMVTITNRLKIEDGVELAPASAPLEITATLLCKDRRTRPTAQKPKAHELFHQIGLCYVGPTFQNKSTHVLTFNYTFSVVKEPATRCHSMECYAAQCARDVQTTATLEELCEAWQP